MNEPTTLLVIFPVQIHPDFGRLSRPEGQPVEILLGNGRRTQADGDGDGARDGPQDDGEVQEVEVADGCLPPPRRLRIRRAARRNRIAELQNESEKYLGFR